jgi:hypothetical protein
MAENETTANETPAPQPTAPIDPYAYGMPKEAQEAQAKIQEIVAADPAAAIALGIGAVGMRKPAEQNEPASAPENPGIPGMGTGAAKPEASLQSIMESITRVEARHEELLKRLDRRDPTTFGG